MPGKLYLIPTPLSEQALFPIPEYTLNITRALKVFVVERGKTARQFLKTIECKHRFAEMQFFELNKRTDSRDLPSFLAPALTGEDVGLLSEAGCPGVADPGADLVLKAHELGIEVVPLLGPSSILMALMSSGMNGQNFAFYGYLPIKTPERKKRLQQLERQSAQYQQTQIFIETPYRNNQFAKDCISTLKGNTLFGIACDISTPNAYIKTLCIKDWKKETLPDLHKRPAIFMLLSH